MTETIAGSSVEVSVYLEVTRFLYDEAEILDERRFPAWLDLLAEDMTYRMPVRLTRHVKDGAGVDEVASYFEDDLGTLRVRLARLDTKSAWSEDPPSRTRHFVSNIVVDPGEREDELRVRSCLLFIRNRGSDPDNDQLTGVRHDVLRRVDGAWKMARRTVFLDQTVLGTLNLSTIY